MDAIDEAVVAMGGELLLVERGLGERGGVVDRVVAMTSPADDGELRTLLDAFG